MNVYLDDERDAPEGWVRTYTPEETIALLKTGQVKQLSLDHDLGTGQHGNGYDVLLWLEWEVAVNGFQPPKIYIHTANPSAAQKMKAAAKSILNFAE